MSVNDDLPIFLVCAPGLEDALAAEARSAQFRGARSVAGGVALRGNWRDVWRANLELRGVGRVQVGIATFRADHLAALDRLARKVAWGDVLRADTAVHVEATCRKSRIYHSDAAAERIARAIGETLGTPLSPDAAVVVRVRIDADVVTLSVDTSGEPLHKRGYKQRINAAPMRETSAALVLRMAGFDGTQTVVDPMCGSGTFIIEAAEIAARLPAGRMRTFAFEHLATFDRAAWQAVKSKSLARSRSPAARFYGSDRDAGAIEMSATNAACAGIDSYTHFEIRDVRDLEPPQGAPGIVIVNPPYGERIGDKTAVKQIYRTLGETMVQRFCGWRIGLITTDADLANATGLAFNSVSRPIAHGGLRVKLYLR